MVPKAIKLHRESRTIEIVYQDRSFELPIEFLRVYSPSAKQPHQDGKLQPASGKKYVNVDRVAMVGNYAIRLDFNDGHNTGLYSFERLRQLAENQHQLWEEYLSTLAEANLSRLPQLH